MKVATGSEFEDEDVDPELEELARRARKGDRKALAELCARIAERLRRDLHGKIGRDLRRLHDTMDIVQSTMGEFLKGLDGIRSEAAILAWARAIARHKLASKRRRAERIDVVPLEEILDVDGKGTRIESRVSRREQGDRLLEAVVKLFPLYPVPMSILYYRYFEKKDIPALMKHLDMAERSVHRHLQASLQLLRSALPGI